MNKTSNSLTLIIGLGITGLSCLRYLRQQNQSVTVLDTRAKPPGLAELKQHYPDVRIITGELDPQLLMQAKEIILSPGISLKTPAIQQAIEHGVKVIGDVELFARAATKPIIAITGSNGKSTVVSLVGDMITAAGFKAAVCGNIGKPVLDCLALEVDFYVMELSSFQLETTHSLAAQAAVILNLSADHMDRYATLTEYLQAKQRIYKQDKQAIINVDEPELWRTLEFDAPPISFSLDADQADFNLQTINDTEYLSYKGKPLIAVKRLPYPERHNLQNALASLALGCAVGLPFDPMIEALLNFKSLAHRCQLIGEFAGIKWINDSKATNVGSTVAAINSLAQNSSGRVLLIAGGDSKKADLTPLILPIKQRVSHAILLGQDATLLADTLQAACPITQVANLAEAVNSAASLAKPHDIVLLSPACSSLDQFKNFAERGERFTEAVKQYYKIPSP